MSRTFRRDDYKGFNKHTDYKKQSKGKMVRGRKTRRNRTEFDTPKVYNNAMKVQCPSSQSYKWLFHSFDAARLAARDNDRVRIRNNKQPKHERAYFCKACGGFHLTTMSSGEWEARKKKIFGDEYKGPKF